MNCYQLLMTIVIFTLVMFPGIATAASPTKPVPTQLIEDTREIALMLYDQDEVSNDRDWFGIWHFPEVFADLNLRYEQSAFQTYRPGKLPQLVVCYFGDPEINDFKLLRDLLQELHDCGSKIYFIGSMGAYRSQGRWLDYHEFNQVLNLAGLEDRNAWTADTTGMTVTVNGEYFSQDFDPELVRKHLTFHRDMAPFIKGAVPLVSAELHNHQFTPVILTPWGGAIMAPYVVLPNSNGEWKIPVILRKFFKTGLSLTGAASEVYNHPVPSPLRPSAIPATLAGHEIQRRFTVLYDKNVYNERENLFRLHLQRWLNLLGYTSQLVDVSSPWDPEKYINDPLVCVAIPTPQLDGYEQCLQFLIRSRAEKIIIAGYLPFYDNTLHSPHWDDVVALLDHFQFTFDDYNHIAHALKIEGNPDYYPGEISITNPDIAYAQIKTSDSTAVSILRITDKKGTWTPAFRSKRILALLGDFILQNPELLYPLRLERIIGDFLSPDAYFPPASGYGPRLAMSHIDGDGFHNTSEPDVSLIGAERIYKILQKTNFPVSVSFIARDILPHFEGRPYALNLARRIINLPNVEAASHTFSHPFAWDGGGSSEVNAVGYTLGDVDDTREILTAARRLSQALPKPVKLHFWSGDCMPLARHLRLARESGLLSINGGDTRYGSGEWSILRIAPNYVNIGNEIQAYCGTANENLYTNLWTGPYDGYRNAIETFSSTDQDCPVTPVDIYYHFYSGSIIEGAEAVSFVYDWVRRQEYSPVFVSEYLLLFRDWLTARIFREGNRVRVSNAGQLRCLRIQKTASWQTVDMNQSRGLLGFSPTTEGWDVFLDPGREHEVVMSETAVSQPPHVRRSTHSVEVKLDPNGQQHYICRGFGSLRLEISATGIADRYSLRPASPGSRLTITTEADRIIAKGEISDNIDILLIPTP